MRNAVLVVLVLVAVGIAVLFATGVLDLSPSNGDGGAIDRPPEAGNGQDEPSDPVLQAPPPDELPELQEYALQTPIRVLLLVGYPQRFNAYLDMVWTNQPRVEVHSWAGPVPATAGSGPPPGTVLSGALSEVPVASTLDDLEIDLVAVHDLDPAHIGDGFWDALYEQVRQGRVGLLAIPGHMHGHDMLAHVGLRRLLPVKSARKIEGPEKPGIMIRHTPFAVTEEGARHPATRLVPWPEWSKLVWEGFKSQDIPWGTPFVFPVEEFKDGATSLVRVLAPQGPEWPAIAVGPENMGRVIWFGTRDLGDEAAYRDAHVLRQRRALVRNITAWLVGQAPE